MKRICSANILLPVIASPVYQPAFRSERSGLNKNLNNGMGGVFSIDTLFACWDASDKITAAYHKNKHDIWLIARKNVNETITCAT